MQMKLFRQIPQHWLLIALLLAALSQMAQVWHHANLADHASGELCQVCLHSSGSAVATVDHSAPAELVWRCVASLPIASDLFVRQYTYPRQQARAPPHYS